MNRKNTILPASLWLVSLVGGLALMSTGHFWTGGFLVLCAFSAFVP